MMWNAMVPALYHRTRIIAYDGSPFHPDVRTFLKFISDQGFVECLPYIGILYIGTL